MTWELTKPSYDQISYIRGRCGYIVTEVERIDKDIVNVTVPIEMDDILTDYCDQHGISCRLI
jgi:hypothetical protein